MKSARKRRQDKTLTDLVDTFVEEHLDAAKELGSTAPAVHSALDVILDKEDDAAERLNKAAQQQGRRVLHLYLERSWAKVHERSLGIALESDDASDNDNDDEPDIPGLEPRYLNGERLPGSIVYRDTRYTGKSQIRTVHIEHAQIWQKLLATKYKVSIRNKFNERIKRERAADEVLLARAQNNRSAYVTDHCDVAKPEQKAG